MKTVNQRDLIKFYQGELDEPRYFEIEEHLLSSPCALMEYFCIKRDREVHNPTLPLPSEQIRHRLLTQLPKKSMTKKLSKFNRK